MFTLPSEQKELMYWLTNAPA